MTDAEKIEILVKCLKDIIHPYRMQLISQNRREIRLAREALEKIKEK
jgi:hypothetical protein